MFWRRLPVKSYGRALSSTVNYRTSCILQRKGYLEKSETKSASSKHQYLGYSQKTNLICARSQSNSAGIVKLEENVSGDLLLSWDDGKSDVFPYVYLRDNCNCPSCFDQKTYSRLQTCYDVNITAQKTQFVDDGSSLEIIWPDGHTSKYSADWLLANSFQPEILSKRESDMLFKPPRNKLWGREMEGNITEFDFHQVMNNDQSLHDFLLHMATVGICVVKNSFEKKDQLKLLVERVAFPRNTYYGEYSQVIVNDNACNSAFLPHPLGVHNDLTYLEDNPGIQLFSCIKQAVEGGENTLVDGFRVVKQLQVDEPEAYHVLTTTPISSIDIGYEPAGIGRFFYTSKLPPILLCPVTGDLKSIRVHVTARDFKFVPLDDLKDLYKAFEKLKKMLYDTRFLIHNKSREGNILVLDNRRVLHGRADLRINEATKRPGETVRHIETSYLEWDDVMSRLRLLRFKLGIVKSCHLHNYEYV